MITLEKYNNKHHDDSCNSCHKYSDKTLYRLAIRFNNTNGQVVSLCKDCLRDIKTIISKEVEK